MVFIENKFILIENKLKSKCFTLKSTLNIIKTQLKTKNSKRFDSGISFHKLTQEAKEHILIKSLAL